MQNTTAPAGMPVRDYLIEEYTSTVCPECFAKRQRRSDEEGVWKDGLLISRHNPAINARSVYLRRFCAEHGETESLYEEDAEIWASRRGWSTPTLAVTPDRADNWRGFPDGYRNGLPAGHAQHTCILLLNITQRCNYSCRACYATALPPGLPTPKDETPTLDELMHTVNTMLAREGGKIGVLMLSGGEPTLRTDLEELVARLYELPITRIMLNTNGRRVAQDDAFVEFLSRYKSKLECYLQFDGFRESTYTALRNENVREEKLAAAKRLNDAKVFYTLVVTAKRGVNEDEVGEILRFGLDSPFCSGAAIQPMFGSGRHPGYDPLNRCTPTGILRQLEQQTGGVLKAGDFIPLPCSHPDCCDITYMIKTSDGKWNSLPSLVGRDELKNWLHLVSNSITFSELSVPVQELLKNGSLVRIFSEQLKVGTPQLMWDLASMCDCVPNLIGKLGDLWKQCTGQPREPRQSALEELAQRTFRITVKMFMDADTFHEARLRQCCVHTGTFEKDPRRYSFCWRWLFADAEDFPERTTQMHHRLGTPVG